MIGKIYEGDSVAIIHNIITKTSNSGLFSNKRLAVLSLKQAVLGYQSKVPQQINKLDSTCINNCKEAIHLKSLNNFTYSLQGEDRSILLMRWRQNEKGWQFKFQMQAIAQEWYQYIYRTLNPLIQTTFSKKKEIEQQYNKIDQPKVSQPSRFKQKPQEKPSPGKNIESQPINSKEKEEIDQKTDKQEKNRFERFKEYQQQNKQNSRVQEQTPPIAITTFRQRFPNNTIFGSIKSLRKFTSEDELKQNWNVKWYSAIETEQEQRRIAIYNDFLRTCEITCMNIIKELTAFKTHRKYIPEKITMTEEIYQNAGITFKLNIEKYIENSQNGLAPVDYLNQYNKLMQNYSFVLRVTKNKGFIKVPLACIFQYYGFLFYCEANIPLSFVEVDHAQKYVFQTQIQRLQSQLNLRINLLHLNLFTDRIAAIEQGKKNHYLIMKDIKILPVDLSLGNSHSFCLSSNIFVQSNYFYQREFDFQPSKQKWIKDFHKIQKQTCTIISYQDLIDTLQKANLSYGMIPQLLTNCQNKYLHRIFATELVSNILCFAVRCQVMILVKKWSKNMERMTNNEHPDYPAFIYKLMSSFLNQSIANNSKIWNMVYQEHYDRHSFNIKMDSIIIGYLLSSISFKLGVNFDFQLLILQERHHFFNEQYVISSEAIRSHESIFIKYANEDMCQSHQIMMHQVETGEQQAFHQMQAFYKLKDEQNFIEPYHWKKICKVFSFYVPYTQQGQHSYLQIYSYLNMKFLDYPIFSIVVSAVKWLLFYKKVEEAIKLVTLFNEISWFWVNESNPFIIKLYQILGEFYKSSNLLQSIKYLYKCNQYYSLLLPQSGESYNLDRSYEIARLLVTCNLHKQALGKYRQVKRLLQKDQKRPDDVLDVMVEICKLYLHLGDIEHCFISCKAAIEFSLLNPFKDQLQQFQVYSLILRSFQIKDQSHKYKFYVDILQDKFIHCTNPFIVQNVLRISIEEILSKYNRYNLKKCAFVLNHFQKDQQNQQPQPVIQSYRKLAMALGKQSASVLLRLCMEKTLDICDLILQRKIGQPNDEQLSKYQYLLYLFCNFVGFEFILGSIVGYLKNK